MGFRSGFFLLVILFSGAKSDRKITAELNPGCQIEDCKNQKVILMHVKAEGANDTLHHLWDFTGKPSVYITLTEKNTSLSVDYRSFSFGVDNSVKFSTVPKYNYGIVINKVIEFNDISDTATLNSSNTNSSYVSLLDTRNFNWKVVNTTNSSNVAKLIVEATDYSDRQTGMKKNGTVHIELSAYGGSDYSDSLPRMLHSGNATQLELTLDGLATQYKNSRFGLQLIAVSSDALNNTVSVESRKSLDDQHAPGIFTVVEMVTPSVKTGQCGGYIQWRPVVYTTANREITSSSDTCQYEVSSPVDHVQALANTLPYTIHGTGVADMLVVATNVTFGRVGDGFYHNTQYAVWTVMVGYGHPPEEEFSMLVTLVLLIGLGLPAVLILTGTVCIVLRRLQRNKDDLFLSR